MVFNPDPSPNPSPTSLPVKGNVPRQSISAKNVQDGVAGSAADNAKAGSTKLPRELRVTVVVKGYVVVDPD